MLLKIQALKEKKIVWPSEEEIGDNIIWVGSIDGTHIKTQEPKLEGFKYATSLDLNMGYYHTLN
jgi:hypothetical protein